MCDLQALDPRGSAVPSYDAGYAAAIVSRLLTDRVSEEEHGRESLLRPEPYASLHIYRYPFSSSRWAADLGSFDRTRLVANFNTDYIRSNIKREHIVVSDGTDACLASEPVECLSFDTIIGVVARGTIDFVSTDVEGYDIQMRDTFPLDRIRPASIVLELSVPVDATCADFVAKLTAHDYNVFMTRTDAIALRRKGIRS